MSYEQFRTKFTSRLLDVIPTDQLQNILHELDIVSADFDFSPKCTEIITVNGIPEIVKIYCASLAIETKAFGTIDGYRRKLIQFFERVGKSFEKVTTGDIRLFLSWKQQTDNIGKATVEQYRIAINAFFNWLVDEEYLQRNPAKPIKPIDVPEAEREPLSVIELEYLRKACVTPRETALVDFLYSTGCRVSECAALTVNDINWLDRSVKIRHGKGDKFRIVYFNAKSEVTLKAYLDSKKHSSPVLFSNSRAPYGFITKTAIEKEIRRVALRAGDRISVPVSPHVLRHTFATNAIDSGMPVEQVQQLLGHASLDTTMIYVKRNQENLKASHRKHIA